jgi:hypothetical protein
METKMKALAYSRHLHTRLKELQAKRKKDIVVYDKLLAQWRKDMVVWLHNTGSDRILKMSKTSLQKERRYTATGLDVQAFFIGAPPVPKYPSDEQINKIKALLRQLAISHQDTITVSTEDVEKYLIKGGEEEDED